MDGRMARGDGRMDGMSDKKVRRWSEVVVVVLVWRS